MSVTNGNVTVTSGTPTCTTLSGNPEFCNPMCSDGGGMNTSERVTITVTGNVMKVMRVETAPESFCAVGTTETLEFRK